MAEVILNNDNFKAEVLDAKGLVVVSAAGAVQQ